MSSERLKRLDHLLQQHIDDNLLAGTVTLVARQGKVVHLSAQGYRDKEEGHAMPTDAIFTIMSMTKPIVSVALMMLYEEGHFLLDDPISNWLPEFADKEVIIVNSHGVSREPAKRPITVRHVLSHTSGVDPDRDLLTEEERALFKREDTLQKTYAKRGPLPLSFHPGDRWQYGSSTDYVALLVEKISGENLNDFLQDRIFRPLGMVDTFYNVPRDKVHRVAAAYSPTGENRTIELRFKAEYREPSNYFPGTYGLKSTVADYFKFHQMMLNGGILNGVRLLSPKTVDLMITNHIGDNTVNLRGPGYGFGLGYSVLLDAGTAAEPLTPGSFAWGTVFWVDPTEQMIGVLMTQITSYRHLTYRRKLAVLATQAITESLRQRTAPVLGYQTRE